MSPLPHPTLVGAVRSRAVAPVPLALRVVARLVAIPVLDPALRAAVLAVGNGPRQVNLKSNKEFKKVKYSSMIGVSDTKLSHANLLPGRVRVEVVRPDVFAEHDVIVHVDELLGQPRDAVDVALNGRRRERGQVTLVRKDFLRIQE